MSEEKPTTVYRSDYRESDYWIDTVDLDFDLQDTETFVEARLSVRRNQNLRGDAPPLVLHGEDLEHLGLWLDGEELPASAYQVNEETLVLDRVPARFELKTRVRIRPQENTELSGLYQTNGNFCTQCEAMGFRRITWFLDRPDVMSRYTTTISADRTSCPVLLSNGNRVMEEDLGEGRHRTSWEDPFPKPSYLFALVAGDLRCHSGTFETAGGRRVALEIWVEPQNIDRCEHALESLQRAMRWDEEVFGLEYDLDIYMIVAVNDFNAGAMENKGLNIFNSKYILARPETATDADYENIESVVAHEYFHNWTGNRVTCRDWFQLTLKEGLTVYRDHRFSSDVGSEPVNRIANVQQLRAVQFAEDAGPMAHPIRPESYISMDNFYTSTVYDKGAEVVGMYETLLGKQGFRRGMDLYFERHDGQAVTCDDFRAAMADANGRDLEQFGRWYSQSGTPVLQVASEWDESAGVYSLKLSQSYPALSGEAGGEDTRLPLHIPVATALLDGQGREMGAELDGDSRGKASEWVLELEQPSQIFEFRGLSERPTPSLLRKFSAPVRLRAGRDRKTLAFLMDHDSDAFSRWDAGHELASELVLELAARAAAGEELTLDPLYSEAFGDILTDENLDGSLKALALTLPGEKVLGQEMEVIDPDGLHAAREFMRGALATEHRATIESAWHQTRPNGPHRFDKESVDRRRFANCLLGYAVAGGSEEAISWASRQLDEADNMTDAQAAFSCLLKTDSPLRAQGIASFYDRWRDDPLVIDKWFSLQALSYREDTFDRVLELAEHPDFSVRNPNRLRALVFSFCAGNQVRFHREDGAGYSFLGRVVDELDGLNPVLAARMVSVFNAWRRFDDHRQGLMKAELERLEARPGLSKPVFEIVARALAE